MQLLPCKRPPGLLESAPRTSLRADTEVEHWDGFWSDADEDYYARCTRQDGSEEWFRLADEDARRATIETRVIALRPREARRMLLLWSRNGGRPMLVGSSRRTRRTRRTGERGGGGAR